MFRRVLLVAAMVAMAACADSTSPPVPTTLELSATTVALDAIGATQTVTAVIKDQRGNVMADVPLTWTSNSPSVTVSGDGKSSATITSTSNGNASVVVAAGSSAAKRSEGQP